MAAGAEGIRAGRAFVEIGADLNPLDKGLNDAKQRLSAFSGALASLGSALALSFATSKITGWIDAFAQGGREIFVMARNAGVGTAELSDLKSAVELLGGNLEETVGSMRKMGIFLENVREGGREATDAINRLGLSFGELNGLSETDKLQKIGEKLATLPLGLQQHLGAQIFGKRGGATVGLAAALGAARAQTAGEGQTAAEIRTANDLALALAALERAQKGVSETIAGLLAPAFLAVTNAMSGAFKAAKEWLKENGELVQKIALIGSVSVGASAAILGVGAAVNIAGYAIARVASIFTGLWGIVSSLAGLVILPFTQLGIAALAIPAALYALGRFTGTFDAIGRGASSLREIFNTTFGGIKDALALGDLGAAWEITLAGMKVAWLEFQVWLANNVTKTPTMEEINPAIASGRRAREALLGIQGYTETVRPPTPPEQQALQAAQDNLENLNRDVFYRNYSAEQARGLEGLPDMGDIGQQLQGVSRSTFNRDVLFGFGGTPMQQLIDKTQAIVDVLAPILQNIEEGVIGLGPGMEVA